MWISISLAGALLIALVAAVYLSNRALRPDFWTYSPGKATLPAPRGLYVTYLDGHIHDPKQDFGLAFEDVSFPAADGKTLRGWLIPGNSSARISAVMVHGLGADRRNLMEQAPLFHNLGYPVLLFDCRNHGISDGDGIGPSGAVHESEDVISAASFLRQQRGYQKVVAIGGSQGGASVILAAGRDKNIDGVIAEFPFASLEELLTDAIIKRGIPRWRASIGAKVISWRLGVGAYGTPLDAIAHIAPRPVFLMHGTGDKTIPYQDSQALFDRAGDPKQLWLAPDADHGMVFKKYPEEFARRVTDFLQAYFPLN